MEDPLTGRLQLGGPLTFKIRQLHDNFNISLIAIQPYRWIRIQQPIWQKNEASAHPSFGSSHTKMKPQHIQNLTIIHMIQTES
jgi:hypothetical protein